MPVTVTYTTIITRGSQHWLAEVPALPGLTTQAPRRHELRAAVASAIRQRLHSLRRNHATFPSDIPVDNGRGVERITVTLKG